MADNSGGQDAPQSGRVQNSEPKKTMSQGIQLLPLLMKYFKTVGLLLGVWVLGYFRFSSTWVMIGLLCHMLNEEYRKIKDAKRSFAKAAITNEKEAILARVEELPSWVYFPDVERAEWLNKVLKQMWPYIGSYTRNLLQSSVQLSVQNSLPASLKPFKFETVELGDVPPRIGGVKVYVDHVKRDEIFMDMEIFYASDTEIKMTVRGMAAGIKDLQIHGTLRVVMKPLVNVVPFIGGVSVFFLNQPSVDFDLTNLANVMDLPLLSNTLRSIIIDQIGNYMVLPNKLSFPLVQNIDLQSLKYPLPSGIVRMHFLACRDLKGGDISLLGKNKSDPYAEVHVGAKKFKTRVIKDTINPTWNQYFEAVVDQKHGQFAEIDVLDEDPGEDDELGSCSLDLQNVAANGSVDTWLPLENVNTGMIHLRAMWLYLSKDPSDLDRTMQDVLKTRTESGIDEQLSSALIIVTLDSAKALPRSKKSMSEPLAFAKLTIGNETQESIPFGSRSVNPKWEANFQYLIKDPRNQDLLVQIFDSAKNDKKLGWCNFSLKTLLTAKDLTSEQELPLKESGPLSKVRLRLCMRILTNVQPADWHLDSVHDSVHNTGEDDTVADEGTSVDGPAKADSSVAAADSTSPAVAPGTPPATPPGGAPYGGTPVPDNMGGVVEESIISEVSSAGAEALPEGLRHRTQTQPSTTSSTEGSLGRIQATIRYSQPRGKLVVVVHKCVNLVGYDENNLSDPYVRLYLLPDKKDKKKTQVIKDELNPVFDETFDWSISMQEAQGRTLLLSVKNKNSMFSKSKSHMGDVAVDLSKLDLTQALTEWFELEEPAQEDD